MRIRSCLALAIGLLTLSGCYHATIETGLDPSTQVITKAFAPGWIYGLVPPKTISTMALCPHGVAKVETQLSFVNQLVNFLTLGIFTPMEIKVTCASAKTGMAPGSSTDLTVADPGDQKSIQETLQNAATLAVEEHRAVYVQF
jgi:hypothetical protein